MLLHLLLQVFFGKSLETLADLFRGRVKNPGVAVYNLLVLAIGILFVVLSVIYSKRMLRKLEAEELAKEQAEAEAAAAAAAAADDVEAAQSGSADGSAAAAVADKLRVGLPLQISDKLQGDDSNAAPGSAAGAGNGSNSPAGSCSQGDLQVIVTDASVAPNSSSLARTPSSNSWIPAGQQEAGSEGSSSGSFMSRMSSVSSFTWLLSGRQQPSAPAASSDANLL
jgi:Na+-transporting methylmalonyl-CoA/oxaloacetate decarboxylase gamma subunit